MTNGPAGLGDVAMHRGEFRQAIKHYNDSLRLGFDSVWLRQSLAKAYISLDDRENAVRNWKNALKFNPFDQETKGHLFGAIGRVSSFEGDRIVLAF